MVTKKRISVYARSDGWYIHAMSTTTVGLSIAAPPYLREFLHLDSKALGEAVLLAFGGCQVGVPHPHPNWDPVFRPMLELANVRTWAEFMRDAPSVDVECDEEKYLFRPSRNCGPREGYSDARAEPIKIPKDASPEQIGEATRLAIALCEFDSRASQVTLTLGRDSRADIHAAIAAAKASGMYTQFFGPQPAERVHRSQEVLGLTFPPSYLEFVSVLGCGMVDGEEFYGILGENVEYPSTPNAVWITSSARSSAKLPHELILVGEIGDGWEYAIDTSQRRADGECPVIEWLASGDNNEQCRDPIASDFGALFLQVTLEAIEREARA